MDRILYYDLWENMKITTTKERLTRPMKILRQTSVTSVTTLISNLKRWVSRPNTQMRIYPLLALSILNLMSCYNIYWQYQLYYHTCLEFYKYNGHDNMSKFAGFQFIAQTIPKLQRILSRRFWANKWNTYRHSLYLWDTTRRYRYPSLRNLPRFFLSLVTSSYFWKCFVLVILLPSFSIFVANRLRSTFINYWKSIEFNCPSINSYVSTL